jgi:phosphatidylglycerophosphate synthase
MLKNSKAGVSFQKEAGKLFSNLPFSANQITIGALIFALIGFYFAYLQQPLPSLVFFILAGATDAIDGAVARARNEVSARGAYIDGVVDRLVEFLFIISFSFFALPYFFVPVEVSLALILFFGTCMTSFATAYADHRKAADEKKIARQPGVLPRAERLTLLFFALGLVMVNPLSTSYFLFATAVLSVITFAQRFWHFAS